jgi:2-polyprenyl-3-methyl-5-hydroxy-6-metoxy-1,4-benzoquinol methylase
MISTWIPNNRDTRVLDLGCGHGALMYFLREAGYRRVTGIDGSPEQISAAKALGLEDVYCTEALPFLNQAPESSYDVVVAFDVFEHLTKNELLQVGDAVHRVLKTGGLLILHSPNGEGIFAGRILHGDLTHEQAFARDSIRQFAGACGFEVVAVKEDVPAVHGLMSLMRYVLWHILSFPMRLLAASETGEGLKNRPMSQNLLAVLKNR